MSCARAIAPCRPTITSSWHCASSRGALPALAACRRRRWAAVRPRRGRCMWWWCLRCRPTRPIATFRPHGWPSAPSCSKRSLPFSTSVVCSPRSWRCAGRLQAHPCADVVVPQPGVDAHRLQAEVRRSIAFNPLVGGVDERLALWARSIYQTCTRIRVDGLLNVQSADGLADETDQPHVADRKSTCWRTGGHIGHSQRHRRGGRGPMAEPTGARLIVHAPDALTWSMASTSQWCASAQPRAAMTWCCPIAPCRYHARLYCDRLPHRVQDVGSSNGMRSTICRCCPTMHPLADGDVIGIGPFR